MTPSGKVELYSERVKQLGHDPLPTYLGPRESPISTPELFKEYPLILNTGHMQVEYWHSQYRELETLRKRVPKPTAEIHSDDAARFRIRNGEPMVIETTTGSLEIESEVTDDIAPGVISIAHGWENALANQLTSDVPADPVSGFPAFTGLLCRVRPVKKGGQPPDQCR